MPSKYRSLGAPEVQQFLDSLNVPSASTQSNQPATGSQPSPSQSGASAYQSAADQRRSQAQSVRLGADQGIETETDPITGSRKLSTHADGAFKYEPKVLAPARQTDTRIDSFSTGDGQTVTPGRNNIMLGGGGADGATGAGFGSSQSVFTQPVRDDRGNITEQAPETKTDSATGRQYVTETDPATGKSAKRAVGIDQAAYEKAKKAKEFESRANEIALRKNNITQARARFDPQFAPVAKQFEEATKAFESIPPPYVNENGTWVQRTKTIDQNTGQESIKEVYGTAADAERLKGIREQTKAKHARAKEAYDRMAPNAENFDRIEKELAGEKLKLESEKLRDEVGLPREDGGVAELLAMAENARQNGEEIPDPATDEAPKGALGEALATDPAAGQQPLLKPDTENEAILSGLGTLRGLDGITSETSASGANHLYRNGKQIAYILNGGFSPVVIISSSGQEDADVQKLVNLGETKGAPLYLRSSPNRKLITEEANDVAAVFSELSNPENYNAQGRALPALSKKLKEMGATPEAIMQRVDRGELSVQHGQAMLKDIYGTTMEATDPDDPATFQKWVEKTTQEENKAIRELYDNPKLTSSNSPGAKLAEANDGLKDFSKMDDVKRDFLVDHRIENAGKPGNKHSDYVRRQNAVNSKEGAGKLDIVGSWLGFAGKTVKNDVLGSMLGLGTGVVTQTAAGGLALVGNDKAAKDFDEFMYLRNRSMANFTNGMARNAKKWATPDGKEKMKGFDRSLYEFKKVIDNELDKPLAERDQARIQAAKKSVQESSLALHELAQDENWKMTADDTDPDKDPALMVALSRYAATADPRAFDQFKARLLMNKGGRELSGALEKKITKDGFWGAVEGGTYAGWQEIGTELLADASMLVTGFGSKAVQKGLTTVGAVAKAKKLERAGVRIGEAMAKVENFGIKAESLIAPLSKADKAGNAAKKVARVGVKALVGEGGEEFIVETGADDPNLIHATLIGALGAVTLAPQGMLIEHYQAKGQERKAAAILDRENKRFAQTYNAGNSDVKGFQPIDAETAGRARNFINPDAYAANLEALQFTGTQLASFTADTPEQQTAIDQLQAEHEQAKSAFAAETERATEAAREIAAIPDEAQRTFFSGIAKVATGNTTNITQGERQALTGRTTASGAPYFANVAGKEVLTDEARAEVLENAPSLGALIQTTESQAIASARLSEPFTQPETASGAQGDPATGSASETLPHVSDASGLGNPSPVAVNATTQPNAAGLDAAEYETLRAEDGSLPDIQTVVSQAVSQGQPVSVTMARAAGIETPDGYTRQGATLVPPVRQEITDLPSATDQATTGETGSESTAKTNSEPAKANTPQAIAERIKTAVEESIPAIRGNVEIVESTDVGTTGGAYATSDGKIILPLDDIAREIQGKDPAAVEKAIQDIVIRHEIVHIVQFQSIRRMWAESGNRGSFDAFFQQWYDKIASELDPKVFEKASQIYGEKPWNAISTEGNKAAELVRMLVEARLNDADQFTELARAIGLKESPTLIETLKSAVDMLIEMVKTGKLPESARVHVNELAALYQEMVSGNAQETADSYTRAEPNAQETPTLMQIGGRAITKALKTYPDILKGKRETQLFDIAEELVESVAELSPAEQAKELDRSITEWVESLQEDKTAKKSGKASSKGRTATVSPARAKAQQLIDSGQFPAINAILESGSSISRRPNRINLILSRKRSGKKLTNAEIRLLNNDAEYDGALTQSMFPRAGDGAVAREVLSILTTKPGQGMRPDEVAGYYGKDATASDLWEQLYKEVSAISEGKAALEGDPNDPNRERTDEEIEAELAERKARGEWTGDESQPQPRTLPEIITDLAETYGENADLPAKLSLITEGISRLPEAQQTAFLQAIEEEGQRIHYGVISAKEWQKQNPGLDRLTAGFQQFLDNHDAKSIRGGINKLLSQKGQEVIAELSLASSPSVSPAQDAQLANRIGKAGDTYQSALDRDPYNALEAEETFKNEVEAAVKAIVEPMGFRVTSDYEASSKYFDVSPNEEWTEYLDDNDIPYGNFQVRASNHKATRGGNVWSFEPRDGNKSDLMGIAKIRKAATEAKQEILEEMEMEEIPLPEFATNNSISSSLSTQDLFSDAPRTAAKDNAQKAFNAQPEGSKGREAIATQIAKREGLADPARFAAQAQKSFDFTQTTTGSKEQPGLDFGDNGRPAIQTTNGQTLEAPGQISLFASPAYHGTPHKVDKFSTDNIGSGEGAQAYGYGLYFAADKAVAEQYRINLAYDPEKMKINGKQINAEYDRISNLANRKGGEWQYEVMEGLERLMTHDSPKQVLEYGKEAGWETRVLDYFRNAKFETFGNLYTVTLKADPEELLDWDKPLNEQSEKVKNILKNHPNYKDRYLNTSSKSPAFGNMIYEWFANGGRNPEQGSTELLAAGIKGIRYLDGNSRSDGQGSYNYVIFNDADIEITHENGRPVAPTSLFSAPTRVTPKQDAEYLAAVKSGDMVAAQSLVDEAAYDAGFRTLVEHGTHRDFEVFDRKKGNTGVYDLDSAGIWTTDAGNGKTYGAKLLRLYGKLKNPKRYRDLGGWQAWWEDYVHEAYPKIAAKVDFDAEKKAIHAQFRNEFHKYAERSFKRRGESVPSTFSKSYKEWLETAFPGSTGYRESLIKQGYDGVQMDGDFVDGELQTIRIFLESNQLKSADPITYDADGNVIPLSKRFDDSKDSILFSSPSKDDKAAIEQALENMPPIARKVFEAVSSGMTEAEVMAKYPINAKAVTNILNEVRARIAVALAAASPEGLKPAMRDGKIDGGRADLAYGAEQTMAAIDQIRNESEVPGVREWADIIPQAEKMLADDYQGTYDRMLAKATNMEQMSDLEVAATKMLISRETMQGRASTPAERVKIAMLLHGYRDIGTETARSLAIRRDPHKTPAERHAQFIAEALFTPDAATRKSLRNASPGQQQDILASWITRVDAIKSELKNRGLDLDASLAAFNEKNEARKQAERDSPRVKAAVDEVYRKLTRWEKSVVDGIRSGQKLSQIMSVTGLEKEKIIEIHQDFDKGWDKALENSAMRYLRGTGVLASSPTNPLESIKAQFGWQSLEDFDDTAPDYKERQEAKNKRSKPKKTKAEEILGTPTRELTDKQKAAIERFVNATPSTWQAIRQETIKLFPESKGFPDSYEATQDARRILTGQLFPENINETQGTFDLNDPLAMKEVAKAFSLARSTWGEKVMEYWKMSILTGPQTGIVNMSSNVMHAAYRALPRRAAEAGVNTVLSSVGLGSKESATFGEFKVMAENLGAAARNAARHAFGSPVAPGVWQLEQRTYNAYATQDPGQTDFGGGVGAENYSRKVGGIIGDVMNMFSFRALTTADEYIRYFSGQLEASAQAHRIARSEENLRGEAYEKRLKELLQPGSIAWVRSIDEVDTITFQSKIDGNNPQSIHRIDQLAEMAKKARSLKYIGKPLEFFIPFVDTPTNIFKEALIMSPVGGALAVVDAARAFKRRYFRAQANGTEMPIEQAKAEAEEIYNRARLVRDVTNQTISIAAFYMISEMVKPEDDDEGLPFMTGTMPYESSKKGERDNSYAVMPPMSFRIGKTFFSYKRFEPFATWLASGADLFREADRAGGMLEPGVFSNWMGGFKNQLHEKTFLQGFSNLADVFENPDRAGTKLAVNITTGFIPNFIRQPIRNADPILRDTRPRADEGFWKSLAKGVGYSVVPQSAPEKIDVWGNPIKKNRGDLIGGNRATETFVRIFDPTNITVNPDADPIDLWIFKYNLETPNPSERVSITPIPDRIRFTVPGEKKQRTVALSADEVNEANANAGKAARAVLGEGWEKMPRTAQLRKRIEDTVRSFQSRERARLKSKKLAEGLPPLE